MIRLKLIHVYDMSVNVFLRRKISVITNTDYFRQMSGHFIYYLSNYSTKFQLKLSFMFQLEDFIVNIQLGENIDFLDLTHLSFCRF